VAKKAITYINIDGVQEITRFTHVHIDQSIYGHHEFRIQVPIESIEGEGKFVFNKSKSIIGKAVQIGLTSDLLLDASSPPFVGIVTNIGFARSHGSSNDLVIEGKSPTILMDTGRNFRSFSKKTLADVVDGIMENYGLEYTNDPVFTTEIPYIVQYGESDLNFLQRIAARYSEWIYFHGSSLVFGKLEDTDAIPLILGRNLYNFELKLALAPTNYETAFYDYKKSDVYTTTGADSEISDYDPAYGELAYNESGTILAAVPSQLNVLPTKSEDELKQHVKHHLDQTASSMVNLYADSDHIGLGVGQTLSVTAAKGEDRIDGFEDFGKFVITKIHHYIGGDGDYHNSFQAIPVEVKVPPTNPNIHIPLAQPELAIVTENIDEGEEDDPNLKLGRIKVKFHWQKGEEETPWIRLVKPHAGLDHGAFTVPEKKDEVMVSYIHQHPDRPFVLGSVYNKDAKPAESWPEEENNIKAFKTKSDNEVIFNDKEGEATITILNNSGKNSITMTMNSGGSISISTDNQMSLSGKNISISANENFTVNAKNIKMTAEENINVAADSGLIDFKASTNFNVTATDMVANTSAATSIIAQGTLTAVGKGDVILGSSEGKTTVTGKTGADFVSEGPVIVGGETLNASGKDEANFASKGPVVVGGSSITVSGKESVKVEGAMVDIKGTGPVVVSGSLLQLN